MLRPQFVLPGWATRGTTTARGYAHFNGRFLTAEHLATVLGQCRSDEAWRHTVSQLNGCFAAVTRHEGRLLAAVDRLRTIPLFYSTASDGCFLSDSAYQVQDALTSRRIDPVADVEFQLTGYVTGFDTLDPGVSQLQAGEVLRVADRPPGKRQTYRYHTLHHVEGDSLDTRALIARLEHVHGNVFRRLIQSVGDRPIVVPLSGGYDSRLIAVSLRELGARDVVCYTYGMPGNWEVGIARELASYLGFRWEFIPYSGERWRASVASEPFAGYFVAAGNLVSTPHIQDWPAVYELHRDKRIPPESVFVPGHTGDFLTGGHIPRDLLHRPVPRRTLLDSLYRAHYSLWNWPSMTDLCGLLDKRVESIIGQVPKSSSPAEAADLFERWELQERQAKFICNAVRVYEDFGYEWRLPLFDHELMDFWTGVAVELRAGRTLYRELLRNRQQLPVTQANKDRSALTDWLVSVIGAAGMTGPAKRARRTVRRLLWRRQYANSFQGSFAIVDSEFFRQTYTGKELLHSYVALAYRDVIVRRTSGNSKRRVILELPWN